MNVKGVSGRPFDEVKYIPLLNEQSVLDYNSSRYGEVVVNVVVVVVVVAVANVVVVVNVVVVAVGMFRRPRRR